jgi:hypothetical protein
VMTSSATSLHNITNSSLQYIKPDERNSMFFWYVSTHLQHSMVSQVESPQSESYIWPVFGRHSPQISPGVLSTLTKVLCISVHNYRVIIPSF